MMECMCNQSYELRWQKMKLALEALALLYLPPDKNEEKKEALEKAK